MSVGHFLLSRPAGSLVIVLVASAVVAFVVWCAVLLAVALTAFALWRVGCALQDRLSARFALPASGRRRVYRPGGKL